MTAGSRSSGDNIIDRTTVGPFSNDTSALTSSAPAPSGAGNSYVWSGPATPPAPSDGGVEQYFDPGEDNGNPTPGPVEQAYAKPTDAATASALGPGMRSRG